MIIKILYFLLNQKMNCRTYREKRKIKNNKNLMACFMCNKMLKKYGGTRVFLPDFHNIDEGFYKCILCSKFNSKNSRKEKHFFDTYKKGKYAYVYDGAVRVPIVLKH